MALISAHVMNSEISQIKYPADIPARNFYRRLLDPLIAIGLLYLISVLIGHGFSAQHVVLAILTFFISSTVFSCLLYTSPSPRD